MAVAQQLGPLGGRSSKRRASPPARRAGRTIRRPSRRRTDPEVFANKTVGQVADHFDDVIRRSPEAGDHRPLLRRAAHPDPRRARSGPRRRWPSTPAPFRGVLPLPISALKSARRCSAIRRTESGGATHVRAVPLRVRQRGERGGGQGALRDVRRARAGEPLFQAAAANLNPWTEAKVDTKNPERGPMLIISGEKDHTVPWSIPTPRTRAEAQQRRHRDRRDPGPRTRAHHRQRMARGRQHGARLRQAVRLAGSQGQTRTRAGRRSGRLATVGAGPCLSGRQWRCNGDEHGMTWTWNVTAQPHARAPSFL